MTDEDALKIADRPDWWMGPDGPREAMRTLRAALDDVADHPGRVFLFRPGGFGLPGICLSDKEIAKLRIVLEAAKIRAA